MKNRTFEKWWSSYYHETCVSMSIKNFMCDAFKTGFQKGAQANKPLHPDTKPPCDHKWMGLYGHPAAYECKKCKALCR